ncbi:hypothetical protein BJV77DRAFT_1059446 [Russula vinacea]|nr:hypothetical protein BJV77DRAFT_1059446 [Russula vinacea]
MASNKPTGAFSPTATPKYLNDFSKALASEVRILLQEVGKLRDERRALQHEIAELMAVKAKHSAGGEYSPDWRPKVITPNPTNLIIPPRPRRARAPSLAHRRQTPRARRAAKGQGCGCGSSSSCHPPPPPPPPAIEAPRPDLPSWAQWRPNPNVHPVVRNATPSQAVVQAPPPRQGLFGPVTPPPS